MRSALNSTAVWELTTEGERLFQGKKEFFRASLHIWYLQYWALFPFCRYIINNKFNFLTIVLHQKRKESTAVKDIATI